MIHKKTVNIYFTKSCRRRRIATPIRRQDSEDVYSVQICIFIFCVLGGKTALKDRRGLFLKDLELTRIRNANKAAVSVAIRPGTARRCYKSNAAFAGGWDASLRGQTGFCSRRRVQAARHRDPECAAEWLGRSGERRKRCEAVPATNPAGNPWQRRYANGLSPFRAELLK